MSYGPTIHKIGATPISDYAREAGFEIGIGDLIGGDIFEPYTEDLVAGTHTLSGRDYPLFLTVLGKEADGSYTRERYLTNVLALGALIFNNGAPFTLTRILALSSGTQTATIRARYKDGFRVQQASWSAGRVAPVLTLLDARWAISGGGTSVL